MHPNSCPTKAKRTEEGIIILFCVFSFFFVIFNKRTTDQTNQQLRHDKQKCLTLIFFSRTNTWRITCSGKKSHQIKAFQYRDSAGQSVLLKEPFSIHLCPVDELVCNNNFLYLILGIRPTTLTVGCGWGCSVFYWGIALRHHSTSKVVFEVQLSQW